MGFAKVHSGQTHFLAGQIIDIEIDLAKGLHAFSIVGLPDKAVAESKDRISAAIKNSGFKSPKYKNQKVVISLAPADVKKEGPAFDLAMAIGYLLAAEEIRFDPSRILFLGELSLDGALRPITGALAIVAEAERRGFTEIFLPRENVDEAALVSGVHLFPAEHFRDVIAHVNEKRGEYVVAAKKIIAHASKKISVSAADGAHAHAREIISIDDIHEQRGAKRVLEIAAAGGHNILLSGPPGTGKTMLARAFRELLPALTREEIFEVTTIHSAMGMHGAIHERPFRAPHHTSSFTALIGGGPTPRPGEMTLAHRGILFLDEFPEFDRSVIEALREPLEEREVRITRGKSSVVFPAHFILVAAMNPCPCGWYGSTKKECVCTTRDHARYARKISGPILDRIDLRVHVGDINFEKMSASVSATGRGHTNEMASARARITFAHQIQHERKIINASIAGKDLAHLAPLTPSARALLTKSAATFKLSVRAYHRTWRVARTIADLDPEKPAQIEEKHVLEALQFRGEEKV